MTQIRYKIHATNCQQDKLFERHRNQQHDAYSNQLHNWTLEDHKWKTLEGNDRV